MVATMAGTTRRMSMPARPPIAKATSVQAANATPRRSNRAEENGDATLADTAWLLGARYGW